MNLIVGATGLVGSEICRLLREKGEPVRAMVRSTSNPDAVARLQGMGVEVVRGDLKDRASLEAACRGASTVLSTASATGSRQSGDSLAAVDEEGQLGLIDAAAAAGVRHFVMFSFPEFDLDFPLQTAKRASENRLRKSGMTYTILQPTCFAEVWLSPHLGFDVANARARLYGTGRNKVSWISFRDVAKFAVAALENPKAKNAVLPLGGPDALSPLEVVHLAEEVTGKTFEVEQIPEDALRAQYGAATDSMQKSFAGLMLYVAGGEVIDMKETLRAFPIGPLHSVREHLEASS